MGYSLSLHEIESTATKALSALGFPPGLDTENAANVTWLEAHGFKGVDCLAQELNYFADIAYFPSPTILETTERFSIQSGIQSGFLLAQSGLDFAESEKPVLIGKCWSPLIVVAEAARRSKDGYGFCLETRQFCGGVQQSECYGNGAWIADFRLVEREPLDLLIQSIIDTRPTGDRSSSQILPFALENRTLVNESSWQTVINVAKRGLVANNAHSRAGAGAEIDDSS